MHRIFHILIIIQKKVDNPNQEIEIIELQNKNHIKDEYINTIVHSYSYKVGRTITYIPRKVRELFFHLIRRKT